jgi:2-polyprenyl-6-methoxyphenol hydroxylase-like FAD-dependent oxidoreductase
MHWWEMARDNHRMNKTDVAIIGGGPAGLMLALELGCRGIDCVLIEEDLDPPQFPKANATSSRTMEHYRRRGLSEAMRATGLVADHPQDIAYCTRLSGRELTRFSIPSRTEALHQTSFGDYGEDAWPTPELPHRGNQMLMEPILQAELAKFPSVKLLLGYQATKCTQNTSGVTLDVINTASHETLTLTARYAVGCDGPRSMVRKSLGIKFGGVSEESRDFFGGQMLSIYFKSKDLYDVLGKKKAWQYWAINPVQRGLLIAINGIDSFLFGLQLKPGQTPETVDYEAAMLAAIGKPFDFELIAKAAWNAGFTLVAEKMASGRVFLAGDAAHLFTPTSGMGYNTSVDDAVNLGWKLAAVIQGWAGESLLDSYDAERRPIAHRNTAYARSMADSIGLIKIAPTVDDDSADAEQLRTDLGAALAVHVRREFNAPGLHLGLRYEDSPIIAVESGAWPADLPGEYLPSARPGARAPHIWLEIDGKKTSLFDLFGRDFTLLSFNHSSNKEWLQASQDMGLPLVILPLGDSTARDLYDADLVLIRPDHHIAWRGDVTVHPADVLALVTRFLKNYSR